MRPFIQDGDLITVSPLQNSPVKVGDVVLYKTLDDQVIVHRVIRKTIKGSETVFFIKGDANLSRPEEADRKRVLGRVVAIERNRRKRKLDTKLYRIIGLFFALLSPFSRWIYPLGSKVKHKGRKHLGIILEKIQSFKLYGLLAKKLMKKNIHYQIKDSEDFVYQLVAKHKDMVIGGVTLSEFQESNYPYTGWWLFGMKINWRYRRMRIGEKLTKMAADIAAKHGASEIKLLVFEDAKPANNLYRKSGFRQISVPELNEQLQEEAKKTSRLRIILAKDIKS